MRILLQRVKRSVVKVASKPVSEIGPGLLLLIGIHQSDTEEHARFLAEKCSMLRVFEDDEGKMNRSIKDVGGSALVVSQFTLYADCHRGRRPSFSGAAPPERARALYEYFVTQLRLEVANVQTGIFGALMEVDLTNHGPVTLILETG